MLASACSVAVKVSEVPLAALILLDVSAIKVALGVAEDPPHPEKVVNAAAARTASRFTLRRRGRKTHKTAARLMPPVIFHSSGLTAAPVVVGEGASVASVTVAVCADVRLTLAGATVQVAPAGTPPVHASATVPV